MAVSVVGSLLNDDASAGNDLSFDVSGHSLLQNDIIVFCGSYPVGGTPGVLSPGAAGTIDSTGWTDLFPAHTQHGNASHSAWAFPCGASPPSTVTFTVASGSSVRHAVGQLVVLRGATLTGSVFNSTTTTGTTASTAHPAVTMPSSGAVILWSSLGALGDADVDTPTYPTGFTTHNNFFETDADGNAHTVYICANPLVGSGDTGTFTVNFTSNAADKIAFTIGLAASGGGSSIAAIAASRRKNTWF